MKPNVGGRLERDVFVIGDVLSGVYEIRGVLGQGGMGQVFDAWDRMLRRSVAIKVAWPQLGPAAVRSEAQALAAIRHPSMVTVYAWGEHGGTEYVAMERLSGDTLEAHVRRRGRTFDVPEVLEILASLADAIAAVHQAGIAHRDVKPENVMLVPGGRVVLMDFGVFAPEFAMGAQGSTSGSPAYMAPETISGSVTTGDGFLVDIYAFGVLAFEVSTGTLPFAGETARDFYMKHLGAQVPSVRERRSDLPLAFDALVRQLMAKDPHERPHAMDEVAHQLRRLLQLEARAAAGPSSVPTSSRLSTGPIVVRETGIPGIDDVGRSTQTRRRT